MNKKGQAALEFLMTYGWAFLVILVMIGALVYFGVLNTDRFIPDRCVVSPGFSCEEFQISSDRIRVILRSQNSQPIILSHGRLDGVFAEDPTEWWPVENTGEEQNIEQARPERSASETGTIRNGELFEVVFYDETFDEDDLDNAANSKTRFTFEFNYSIPGREIPQRFTGEIYGTIFD
ncbi:MAG: hypothetical protein ACMXYK_03020 [Candidatus Woesearchaeota archaeon]